MELLLTIAVLAIVAASTIPIFWGGGKETLEDAKKSNMLAAYQSARTGAYLLISIVTAKAQIISGNLDCIAEKDGIKKLDNYSPISSRVFEGKNGNKYVFGAKVIKDSVGKDICIMTYAIGEDPTQEGTPVTDPGATDSTVSGTLNTLWDTVFAGEPQQ